MSIVTLKFDNTLEKSNIILPLLSSSQNESGNVSAGQSMTDKAQTAVFGIQTPLIMINYTVIDFDAVKYFSLKSTGRLPELVMTVEDKYELINNIDKPGNDNEVRVQILPRFDNAYKKIDLTFFISNIQVSGSLLRLTCTYKLPSIISSQFKTYGEIDTYTLFENIATETKLGFASNINPLTDLRYTYCDNKSLLDLMNNEIQYSNANEHILDWWIDLWDNINLVDIKERYNTVDNDEDLKVWIAGQINEVTVDNEVEAIQATAVINNLPMYNSSELFVKEYSINNKSGVNILKGTDKVCGIYNDIDKEYSDFLIQDGDIKNDIFTKYNYIGESYGEYNYLLAKELRESFIQKIVTETITVTLQSPLLGLMRGHKLNFIRYVNNDMIENKLKNLEEQGIIDRNIESNIPLSAYDLALDSGNGNFVLDRTVSGQYLILGVNIIYNNYKWDYILTLAKPASTKASILKNN